MGVVLYGIKNCDTVKKARAWLDTRGVRYEFHDYKTSGVERKRLEQWCTQLGWEHLLNRAGTTFRRLSEHEKKEISCDKAIGLMIANPSVIKRPLLDTGNGLMVGFKPELYERALLLPST